MADSVVEELVEALKGDARAKFLDLMDEVSGRKVLLLDSTVLGPLGTMVSPGDLKDHGAQEWFKLSDTAVATDCSQILFLVRCTRVELIDCIAAQVIADDQAHKERTYVVVFLPRATEECLGRLTRCNVRANVRVAECAMHFFPLDGDLLSMEVPGAFSDFHVQGDPSGVFYAAKALMFIQAKFGAIPAVHAIGGAGKAAVDVLLRLRREEQLGEALRDPRPSRKLSQKGVPPVAPHHRRRDDADGPHPSKIAEVVIVDRRVDIFSVLCSQFTYQALVDNFFGIHNATADVSSAAWAKERNKEQVRLSSDDPFYQEIKNLHIDRLGPLLQEKARRIQETYAEKDNIKNPNEMAEYIKKFKTAQADHPKVETHINMAHELRDAIQTEDYRQRLRLEDDITAQSSNSPLEAIEDYIDDQKPLHEVLRLLCLYSLVNNGVKSNHLDTLKRNIVQAYGYEHLLTLCNMEQVGILRHHQGRSVWSGIKNKFKLFPEDAPAELDISYAYSGYAPLTIRLVQMTRQPPTGWRSCQDALGLLYGPAQELQQSLDSSAPPPDPGQPSVTLVCFIGGVTYGELAALRKLGELEEGRRRFLVLTTEVINAKKLFESLRCEQCFNQPPLEAARSRPQAAEPRRGGFGFWPGGR